MGEEGAVRALRGVALQSKAGPMLRQADGSMVSCLGRWPERLLGKSVVVQGSYVAVAPGQASFPIATRGEDGSWSQGVRAGTMDELGLEDPLGLLHEARPVRHRQTVFKIDAVTLSVD